MSVGPLILELLVVLCVAVILLHHYGRTSKQHPLVTVATLVAWYFSLLIVFILPLDVSSTFYRQCLRDVSTDGSSNVSVSHIVITPSVSAQYNHNVVLRDAEVDKNEKNCQKPWSYVPENTLPAMWHIVYWTSQVLTWFLLPFMQSYSCAGDFTTWGKFKRAVIENAVYYGSYLFIFCGLLIYVAAAPNIHLNISQLKVVLITAANTWGLFLLILLLGYGLVEVPRGVWNEANVKHILAQTYFKLAKLSTEKQEAIEELDDVLEEIKRVADIVQYNHPQRKYVDIVISKCPEKFRSRVSAGMDDYEDYDQNRSDVPGEKVLVRLHRRVIGAVHTETRTNVQWNILMKQCLHLENVAKNSQTIDRTWKEEYPMEENTNSCFSCLCTPSLSWYWFCFMQPKLRKVLAVCLAIVSIMVIWSECTFFNEDPVLSLFAIFINLAVKNYDYVYVELASCLIISYLCVCAYYTVFRIKFFNYYYIAGHHQTDESSLLFVGMMLCRLTAPLCLNFLGMIHLDTALETGVETSYTNIMGHLVVISFISDGFNIYFPILVCVLCTATYFSVGQRCLSAIGFQRFTDAADDMTSDLVEEGRQLVNREKRRLQREVKAQKRAEFKNEFGRNTDMSEGQWSGRIMRKAEKDGASSARYSKMKPDKVELLNDMEPTDYSSLADDEDHIVWEKPSRWTSPRKSETRSTSSRPPKNLFDDV